MFQNFESINHIIQNIRCSQQILLPKYFCEYYDSLGYYFPMSWSGMSRDFVALSLPKGFQILDEGKPSKEECRKIALILDRRLKFVYLDGGGESWENCPLYLQLAFTRNANDEGVGGESITHECEAEVLRLLKAIQEVCTFLNLTTVIKKTNN